jgi:hypothetical protein
MVLVGIFVLLLVSVYKNRQTETPATTFRVVWGVSVVGMFLSLLADFLPQIAGPFALLVALGSITNGGEKVLEQALGVIAPAPAKGSSSPAAPTTKTVTHVTAVGP